MGGRDRERDRKRETAYRSHVEELVSWCQINNLSLNAAKTKDMIIDPRKGQHIMITIGEIEGDRVRTF